MIRLILLTLSLIVFTACDNNDNDSDTTTADTAVVETAPVAGNIAPIVKVYPPKATVKTGETVRFVSTHSSDPDGEIVKYQWLENGRTIARVPFYWKVYNVPGTYKIKLILTDNDGATSSAEYTITVESATVTIGTASTSANTPLLPPGDTQGTFELTLDVTNATESISEIVTTLNITHTWVGDITLTLVSPSGTRVDLVNRIGVPGSTFGESGDDFSITIFDDNAGTAIEDGTPPYNGTFIPEEPLANFIGENANGTWKLIVDDAVGGDTGAFHSWSMTIE